MDLRTTNAHQVLAQCGIHLNNGLVIAVKASNWMMRDFMCATASLVTGALLPKALWEELGAELPEDRIYVASIFLCFSSCILLCAVSCSCIPVANSSCKFYLHWGKHSQAQKLSKQILIRCQVSMIDELANASPNGNRICNWNLQLECNWNATAGNCTEEYVTGKTHAVVVLVKMVLFHYNRIAR